MVIHRTPVYKDKQVSVTKKLRRYWLDVDFPNKPFPVFERSGYVISPFLQHNHN